MTRFNGQAAAILTALMVSACGVLPDSGNGRMGAALDVQVEGDDFQAHLARGYLARARDAVANDGNWWDATAYLRRAHKTLAGEIPQALDPRRVWRNTHTGRPARDWSLEAILQWRIVRKMVAVHQEARPAECAQLQVLFDQWVEEEAEWTPDYSDPEILRAQLPAAIDACLGPPPAPAAQTAAVVAAAPVLAEPAPQPEAPAPRAEPAPQPEAPAPRAAEPAPQAEAPAPRAAEPVAQPEEPEPQEPEPVAQPEEPELQPEEPVVQPVQEVRASNLFLVFFDFDSVELDARALARLHAASEEIVAREGLPGVRITGHADRSGPAAYNLRLSQRRAEAVREVLMRGGADPSLLTLEGFGENKPLVATDDSVRHRLNRRVLVELAE